ncbi:hypothetical protein Taro_052190 [Colocasia esculenta]|uniref:Cysteine-rich receptor-like protein kinase 25 n=1 Tax=Colocasia esculenta TaxID=4460 RepID=A0A843XHY5_COLES|nr:hypothetical protein [Colocasia esculenta]
MALLPLLGLLHLLKVVSLPTTAQPLYTNCSSGANYTANGALSTNLNRLLSSLPDNGSATGFFRTTIGSIPDRVHALVLCRGDVSEGDCRSCLYTAAEDIQQDCPYRRSAIIWYNYCMLRYSDRQFSSIPRDSPQVYMWNPYNVTEVAQFNLQLNALMAGLVRFAAYNASARMFATGEADYADAATPKIYGLVQCTRDQSADDCNACLKGITGQIPNRFPGSRGVRILNAICNVRYSLYTFYKSSAMVTVPLFINATSPTAASQTPAAAPPPPAAGLSPPISSPVSQEGKKKNSTGTVLQIAVPLGSAFVLIAVICVCFCRRKSKGGILRTRNAQEISTVESLLFDLSTLRVATGNFSDQNKLGQGGFGSVYKGLLPNGQEIAVKRLIAGSGQGVEELKNEVVLLAKLQHRNLVRLLGVCLEREEKLLAYEYVWKRWANGTVLEIIDPSLGGQYQRGEVERCAQIGLLCVQEAAAARPTMTTVVLKLSSYSMSLQVPSRPAFFAGHSEQHLDVLPRHPDSSSSTTPLYSQNDVSITELDPR